MFKWNKAQAPLKFNITLDQVGGSAAYLLSDLSGGVTGEIHYVDAGYNIVGVPPAETLGGWSAAPSTDASEGTKTNVRETV